MSDAIANFRRVARGYDPAQVNHHMNELAKAAASLWQEAAERTRQITELKASNSQLEGEVESYAERTRLLEEAEKEAAEPTYAGFGERVGAILTLVDKEANELRIRAQADAANSRALADEHALVTQQDADKYARETSSAAEDKVALMLEDARQEADRRLAEARREADRLLGEAREYTESLRDEADRQAIARQDADRLATARREEAEAAYEQARAKSAAAGAEFETTLAARREASALEFAAQVKAAEQQLAAVRLRSEQARRDSERAQQEAAARVAQELEEATARAQALVSEAKTKAQRIRDDSGLELAAATQHRDSINAQLNSLRHDLAALGGSTRLNPTQLAGAPADQEDAATDAEEEVAGEVLAEVRNGFDRNGSIAVG